MPGSKEEKEKEISAKYTMKIYHEESMISGFLHVRIKRIRNLMKAWKAENEKQNKDSSEE
jgi:hypothetical protein